VRPHGKPARLALAALTLLACRPAAPGHLTLRPGLSVSSHLQAGAARSFAFELRRDQYLALRVTQESIDVALILHPAGGKPLAPLDTQTIIPVPELLGVVAPADGRYVLDVQAAGKQNTGPFRLDVVALRPATVRDRLTVKAQDSLARAEELRRRIEPASDLRALPLYEKAVRLFGQAGDAGGEGYARVQWARVLARRNRKEEAAAALRGCLALPVAAQAPGTRARAATMLAEVLADLGEGAEADAADREALAQWTQLKQPSWQAQVINDLAHRASERGELAQAESLYRRALSLWDAGGDDASAAVALGNLAAVYNLAGEPRLALDAAEQGWARLPQDARATAQADVLAQKGEALAALGRREESQKAFSDALKLLGKGEPAALAQLQRRLARRAYDAGNFDEAARWFRSALAALEAAQDRPSAVAVRQDLAWTELKRGRLEEAERLFQRMSEEARSAENRWIGPASLAGRARLEQARGHLRPALALARQAIDGVELLRREVGRTDLRTSVFANQQSYFDLAVDLTLALYDRTGDRSLLVEAFETSERSRARRLLDLLATSGSPSAGEPRRAATPAAKALNQAEERLSALRSAGAAPAAIAGAERQVRKAVLDLRREEYPAGAAEPGFGGSPLSLREIQRWIGPDTVLLELDLGEDASYLWIVSPRDIRVHRLPAQQDVEAVARRAFGVLSAPGVAAESVQGRETLLAASRLLLGEARRELGARRWLLVMDGALHALPLGALPDPDNPGEPLLAAHEIAYAPSASVAVRLAERQRRRRRRPRKDLAVFADPVYQAEDSGGSPQLARNTAPGALRSASDRGLLSLPRLKFSNDEAEHILSLVDPDARLDARRFDATKARVLSGELEDYRRLHFAVHGLPDENHPELSGLALSLFDRQGNPLDGFLFAHEIARLHLPADLAVLSACQSGRGAAVSGEGLIGLVHAFFTAGTARVVASEWSVNDQATTELMSLFYDGLLRRRLNPARALQQAQLALLRQAPWRRPFFWAGFVVQGGF
jgi:CHAT domain-containing protein/tetratricopeptide (TPR) repeat protein